MTNSNESQQGAETTPPASTSDATDLNQSSSNSPKSNSSNASVPSSKSTGAILLDQKPLLGVNGTGQRKNLTKPFTVSDPIPIDTSSTSKIVKPIKLGTTSSGSEESLNDDIDVEEEYTKELAKKNNITEFKEVSTVLVRRLSYKSSRLIWYIRRKKLERKDNSTI